MDDIRRLNWSNKKMNLTLPEFLVFLVQYCMRYKHDFARTLPLADRLQRFFTHHVCRIDTLSVGFTALGIAGYKNIAELVEGHRLVDVEQLFLNRPHRPVDDDGCMCFDGYVAILKQWGIYGALGSANAFSIFLAAICRDGTNMLRSSAILGQIFERSRLQKPDKLRGKSLREWPGSPRIEKQNRLVVTQQDFGLLILLTVVAPYCNDDLEEIVHIADRFITKIVFGPAKRKQLGLPATDRVCEALLTDYRHRCQLIECIEHRRVRRLRLSPFA